MYQDIYYTPKVLADKLVDYISKTDIYTVVDFCVGDGELLRAASSRWPQIKCFGSDISPEAIQYTKKKHSDWKLSTFDFLDHEKQKNAQILKKKKKFDLILLNPPFSCIGGYTYSLVFNNETYSVSTALKFIGEALKYLKSDGILYAILPANVAYSQKDRKFWDVLVKFHNLSILEETNIRYFQGCVPNIILVSLNDYSKYTKFRCFPKSRIIWKGIEIFRGKISMNNIPNGSGDYYFIHTTNLKKNSLVNFNLKVNDNLSKITGPALLIPRVGKPSRDKICFIKENETYILSDCILAVKAPNKEVGESLFNYFFENWHEVESLYNGTGAKYTTVEKLKHFLNL